MVPQVSSGLTYAQQHLQGRICACSIGFSPCCLHILEVSMWGEITAGGALVTAVCMVTHHTWCYCWQLSKNKLSQLHKTHLVLYMHGNHQLQGSGYLLRPNRQEPSSVSSYKTQCIQSSKVAERHGLKISVACICHEPVAFMWKGMGLV